MLITSCLEIHRELFVMDVDHVCYDIQYRIKYMVSRPENYVCSEIIAVDGILLTKNPMANNSEIVIWFLEPRNISSTRKFCGSLWHLLTDTLLGCLLQFSWLSRKGCVVAAVCYTTPELADLWTMLNMLFFSVQTIKFHFGFVAHRVCKFGNY